MKPEHTLLGWLVWLLLTGCDRPVAPPADGAAASSALTATAPPSPAPSVSASALASSAPISSGPRPEDPPRAIDMHVDTPWQVKFKDKSIDVPGTGQAAAAALKSGQYGGIVYPIYIADHLHQGKPTIKDADEIFDTIDAIVKRHGDLLWSHEKGPTPAGMVTAYVSIEGAGPFAEDITQIDRFIARGVIFVGPVHWGHGKLASSATGKEKRKVGLTELGKKFCARVYEAGGIVDVSHMSDRAFDDLVPIAEKYGAPIVATHSNSRAIADHARNLTDAQLAVIKRSGGVAGLNFYDKYVDTEGAAGIDDLVRHAQHMIAIAGVDHVGIGTDFDGGTMPSDLPDAGHMPKLAAALRKAGLSAEDVHKIFSENTKRVISWSDARRGPKRAASSAEPAR